MNGYNAILDLLNDELIEYDDFESIEDTADRILNQAEKQIAMQEAEDLIDNELLIYTLAKRLELAASKIIQTYKDAALEQAQLYLADGKQSGEFIGVPIQIKTFKTWEYPEDTQRDKYLNELDSFKQKVSGLTKAIKDREKALQAEGKATIAEEKLTLTIKSS